MARHRKAVRSLVLSLALVAAALEGPRAAAQLYPQGRAHWHPLQEGPTGGANLKRYGTGVAVQFTAGPGLDYLGLAGDEVKLWVKPAEHDARVELPIIGNDLAAQTDFQPEGQGQAIVVPGAGGLVRYWMVADALTSQTLGDASWIGAKHVASGQFGGDGGDDFVGVAADGRTVLLLIQQPDGSFDAETGFDLGVGADVKQIEVLDLDNGATGDGLKEVAFRMETKVEIREADGELRCEIAPAEVPVTMAPLRVDALNAQLLAVVTQPQVGEQHLRIYDRFGVQRGAHLLEAFTTNACTPLDFDNQGGIQELVLSTCSPGHPKLVTFTTVSATPVISGLRVSCLDGIDPSNRSVIVADDFDRDGDTDLVYPFHAADLLGFYRGLAVDEDEGRPTFVTGSHGDGTLELTWNIEAPALADANGVQFLAWCKRGFETDIPLEIDSPTPYFNEIEDLEGLDGEVTIPIYLGATDYDQWTSGNLSLYCLARFVRREGEGPVTARGCGRVEVMAGDMDIVEELYLLEPYSSAANAPTPWQSSPNGGGGSFNGARIFFHPTRPEGE